MLRVTERRSSVKPWSGQTVLSRYTHDYIELDGSTQSQFQR